MNSPTLTGPLSCRVHKCGLQDSCSELKATARQQSGMVLLLCLIFMTALTLLGLSASSDTILQKQLASNLRDAEFAKQTALLSLQWAEHWISRLPATAMTSCAQDCSGFYTQPAGSVTSDLQFQPLANWRLQGYEAGFDPTTGELLEVIGLNALEPPMWVIENLHHSPAFEDTSAPENNVPEQDWYRILARSTGRSGNTVSVVESVIVRIAEDGGQTPPSTPKTERVSWRKIR